MLGAVGVREGRQPGYLIFLEDPELDSRNSADGASDAECSELNEPGPDDIRHHNKDCPEYQRGAEVGLEEDQEPRTPEEARDLTREEIFAEDDQLERAFEVLQEE